MDNNSSMTAQSPSGSPANQATTHGQDVKREIIEFVKMVAWFLVLFFVLKNWVIEGYEVQGPSMEPTLWNQERILVFKLPHVLSQFSLFSGLQAVNPGDIIVFDSTDESGKRYVKRVIAEGALLNRNTVIAADGDHSAEEKVSVLIKRGELFVNNHRVDENYLPSSITQPFEQSESSQATLKPGEYFVLGDNRGVSKDSRTFGPIPDNNIIGKAVLRFWPLSKFSILR